MKTLLRSHLFAVLVAAVLALFAQVAAAPFTSHAGGMLVHGNYVEGEVLVKFKATTGVHQRMAAMAARGHSLLGNVGQSGWARLAVGAGQTTATALAAYKSEPDVESVQPNFIYHTLAVPNDTQYGQLWAFRNTGQTITGVGSDPPTTGSAGNDMDIEPAWDHITDCSSVVVAVLDTGVNYRHEDLAANMWDGGAAYPNHGWNFVDDNNDPMDLAGHGTHVAGIIGAAGNNGRGTTGVCWKANIMAVRIGNALGQLATSWIIEGIDFAVSHHAKVINMSFGGSEFDQATSDAISRAQDSDVVLVAAAGNETSDNENEATSLYPCNFTHPNLICVAALDPTYALAGFSNWGANSVDVGAPGTNILSSYAGTVRSTSDALSDWTISGGWRHRVMTSDSGPIDYLADPEPFGTVNYSPGLTDTATKMFDFSDASGPESPLALILNAYALIGLANAGDSFTLGVDPDGINPFGAGSLNSGGAGPFHSGAFMTHIPVDISRCAGHANCLIGFRLSTGASTPGDLGVAIAHFSIDALAFTTNSYLLENGTSMATPEVVGLATMLRAYNPQYTYADTVNAIKNGGRSIPALAGKTTTGKAIDVMSSLAYINPPSGLEASLH